MSTSFGSAELLLVSMMDFNDTESNQNGEL